ncbi:MAG: hypothetical protein GXO90_11410, partial [FCB group bacterium]|nr:hypothetical protein [FCB group bacterium]
AFPVYERWLNPKRESAALSPYTIIFDLSKIPFTIWLLFLAGTALVMTFSGGFSFTSFWHWGLASFAIVLLLSIDLMGSTPSYKSGLHDDRFLTIDLNTDLCKGAGWILRTGLSPELL